MLNLTNKTVFITGASSGIGAACAHAFAQAGAKLILCARNLDKLNTLITSIQSQSPTSIHVLQLDVSQLAAVTESLASIPSDFSNIDILVNNAGLAAGLDHVQDANISDWEEMIDTNVKGLLYMTRHLLPQMVSRNAGHIINIGSVAGHYVYPKAAVYCATKYAVNAITHGLRMDLFNTKVRVSTVDPGAVETNFSIVRFKGDMERAKSLYEGMDPLTPEDVADAVLYCATRPPHVNISEILIMPTDQAAITMVARKSK